MRKNTDTNSRRIVSAASLLTALGFTVVALLQTSCGSNPTVEDTNDHLELIDYIERNEDGRYLFRTGGIVLEEPYSKPGREGIVFRDVLDSVSRQYFTDIPSYFVEKDFGPPFGIVDDAEVDVQDVFYVRILGDSAGTPLTTRFQQRVLHRSAYFLRLRSDRDAYAGWLMHGYNGGIPRDAGMEITKSNGDVFRGDGERFQRFQYMMYVSTEHTGDDDIVDSITVDTFPGRTDGSYMLLQDIERVTKGDRLVIESQDVGSNSIYQKIAAETSDGPIYRNMHRPDINHYKDTIQTPSATNRIWDIICFFEFQFVDRPGGIWCVPYHTQ